MASIQKINFKLIRFIEYNPNDRIHINCDICESEAKRETPANTAIKPFDKQSGKELNVNGRVLFYVCKSHQLSLELMGVLEA